MPKPIFRPKSQADRLWRRFSADLFSVLAMVGLLVLFLTAALAPFLSQDRPIWMEGAEGGWSSPLIQSFSGIDWLWLGLFFSVATGFLVLRTLCLKKRAGLIATGVAVLTLGVFCLAPIFLAKKHERRRYRIEESERQLLREFDEEIDLGGQTVSQLLSQGRRLAATLGGSQVVSLAIYERLGILESKGLTGTKLHDLAGRNHQELLRLKNAVYPLNRFDPNQPSTKSLLLPGHGSHVLGSDELGRDVLARLIYGARTSLTVALGASLIMTLLGMCLGILAGYYGGLVDSLVTRFTEIILCLPALAILVAAPAWVPREWRQSPLLIVTFLGLILWPQTARLVRNEVKKTKGSDHIRSARALGLRDRSIIGRHLIPNILPPILVSVGLTAGNLVLMESTLSFLGLGPNDQPSWGRMLAESRSALVIGEAWHLAIFPGLTVVALMFAFNIMSQSFEKAVNPQR